MRRCCVLCVLPTTTTTATNFDMGDEDPRSWPTVRSNGSSRGSGSSDDRPRTLESAARARGKLHKSEMAIVSANGTASRRSGDERHRGSSRSPSLDREVVTLRRDVEGLRCELLKAKHLLQAAHDREVKMKERLAEQAQKMLERGAKFENVSLGEKRPTALVRRYGNLYTQARVDTLDALDALPQLHDADELKAKLLFSVVVLAFRSVQSTLREIRETVRRMLQMPESPAGSRDGATDPAAYEVEVAIAHYLQRSIDRYNVKKNYEEVCNQIWATLFDYPCLKTCEGLTRYIQDCVKLSWGLSNQSPPFVIEYETRHFRRDMHVRFHTSHPDSEHIKTYLWPALLEGDNGPCVHKGVVVT